jgi:dihydrofolate reductase
MRKLIAGVALSLDGFIEGPRGELNWISPRSPDLEEAACWNQFLDSLDTVFYGRVAYERLGVSRLSGPHHTKVMIADDRVDTMRKYVFSRRVKHVAGNGMVINENIGREVKRIKDEVGKNIWLCGGAGIIQTFSSLRLIDEFMLSVHPVILGGGKSLFQNVNQRLALKLVEKKSLSSGVVVLRYKP